MLSVTEYRFPVLLAMDELSHQFAGGFLVACQFLTQVTIVETPQVGEGVVDQPGGENAAGFEQTSFLFQAHG